MMEQQPANPFDGRVLIGLVVAGIIGFVGFWAIAAFAPELSAGRDGKGHALSRSATGYAAIVELARAAGMGPQIIRDPADGVSTGGNDDLRGLLVLTPTANTTRAEIDERLEEVSGPVLIILPKYQVAPAPGGGDRVVRYAPIANGAAMLNADPVNAASDAVSAKTRLATNLVVPSRRALTIALWSEPAFAVPLPDRLQTVSGGGLDVLAATDGGSVLAALPGRPDTYVLSDPDLVNNLAFKDDARARGALRLIQLVAGPGEPLGFDVTLNGLGAAQRSILRIAFTPPFLALTLCLIAAGLFALWQGFVRYGPPWLAPRNLDLGKRALVATNARLVVQARRTRHFGPRYGAMVREVAARRLHAPSQLAGTALDAWLDRFVDRRGRRFSELMGQLESAQSAEQSVERARALGQWRREILRDGE